MIDKPIRRLASAFRERQSSRSKLTIMRIVVTGASGQLGSYLLDQLVAGPYEVVAWSGSSTGSRAGLRFRPVDLGDEPAVTAALQEADPDVVIHAAAVS